VKIGFSEYDPLAYIHKKDFPDAEITRPGTDTDLLHIHQTCLMTVNGYIHDTLYQGGRLYIPGATLSMLKSRSNVTGVLDFGRITSQLKRIRIAQSMVTPDTNTLPYDKVFITVPEAVVQPILVMGGYLIPHDEQTFYRVADNAFALNLSKLNYMEKLYESARYRDIFKDLELPITPMNPSLVDAEQARSLATIRKYLSLNNSFLLDLGVDNLALRKVFLEHSNIPGVFKTQLSPTLPMVVGYGKLSDYAVSKSREGLYSVHSQDAHYNNHLMSHMAPHQVQTYNDHRLPGDTHRLTQGFFLDITTTR
jgi:hypothetical protein